MRYLLIASVYLLSAASAALADDALPPSWRETNNTVWSAWGRWDKYTTSPSSVHPDSWDSHPAGLSPSPFGSFRTETTGLLANYTGRADVIKVHADDGRQGLEFRLPNLPANQRTEVWVQMTYLTAGGHPNHFFAIGWSGGANYLGITDQGLYNHNDGWTTEAWLLAFNGTASNLRVGWHRFDAYPAYVDQVVIDTRTVPEPATLALLCLSSIPLLKLSRRGRCDPRRVSWGRR